VIGWLAKTLATVVALAASAPAPAPRVPVQVEAAQAQYHNKERKVVFVGAPLVRLVREDAVLLCRRLEAEYDEADQIRRAVCTGDVKLTRGDRIVTCEKATFDNATSKVICVGNPILREGRSVMYGTVLTYDINEDRTVLTQAHGTVIPRGELVTKKSRAKEAPP
jgi:lipopolysaccharide transport protein LptA